MRDMYPSAAYQCGDAAALVTYAYGESEPAERDAIAAHLAVCVACTEELGSLRDTRMALAEWTPPAAELGFQMAPAKVLTPARWWSRPLPAWGQVAAAAVIFASGIAIGASRERTAVAPATVVAAAPAPVAVPASVSVSRQDLQALEQRLRGEIAQTRHTAAPVPVARGANDETLRQMRALIADSEQRLGRELAIRTAEVIRDMDAQRRVDIAQMQRTVGQIQDYTGAAIRDQNTMVNYLVNVSQRR
jgi:hypothetical protein